MSLNTTDINNIKNEFEKLGFDIEDVLKIDGRLMVTSDEYFQLSLTYPITDPSVSTEYFSLFFTGTLHDPEGKPSIEAIVADFYNPAPEYKKDIKADILYTKAERPLPGKDEIFNELSKLLRAKNVAKKFGLDNDSNELKNPIKHRRKF
jgi:hypothetical protein